MFMSSKIFGQEDCDQFPDFNFGITHSTYSSMCFNSALQVPNYNNDYHLLNHKAKITEIQYGFGLGFFMWMPLNDAIVFKPKVEGVFSNACIKDPSRVFATSFDLNISHGFVITFKKPNEDGIIHMARNMTCYLTSKQPYLVAGPKLNLKKYDKGCLQKGYENEFSFGFFIGYGINHIFHGKNYAPEICYHISSTSQNKINDNKKVTHTISLSLNFF